ncbi:MAG: metallopeptidase TldD-related protein [Defluviitaleaceae bacterium]|nr:metallopeptidase TldD-related protein [Defluviitaleaceae bacterium]
MLDILVNTLKSFDGVEYLIQETKTRRVESYNIKKQSEMSRKIETTLISLNLYVVFDEGGKKYRGSYNTDIHPGTSTDELENIIKEGVYAAGFVKNEYFPLVSPTPAQPSKSRELDTSKALAELQAAFHASDNHPTGCISYSEFFITREDVRIINSNGVDVGYTTHRAFVETAVHMPSTEVGEIEITEAYRFSLDDIAAAAKSLQDRVAALFTVAEKKAAAKPTPTVGDINILLSGECLSTFFSYYRRCSSAQMIYQQLSTFKEGTEVQGGENSDRINVILDPNMPGSTQSRPYDDQGLPLESHKIIEGGKLLKYWGDTRFASYLGLTPTGNVSNVHITGGTAKETDLRKEPYLELVSFSDFQVNPVTGDFGSEIRLGYYYDGNNITPVTGGSISGNMSKVQDGLRMSAELRQYNDYKGPATVCMRGASISGVS